ncbi:AzlD domain-containing protein [Anaeromyxobacter sp. PSR-1]|uniref:AzlD domain-containing protein n=1 Tax=unclassified Anaeromyxobacter TaxID=2620896 RepID=UPI0005E99804|nr:AzlD domain-containing protein [Anaeromyxobacter sp. PSR-1]GAO02241.1 branched-chain amino acid transport protein [Anaeromyxobacter sp. PSR-1]
MSLWLVILACGAVTFATRLSFVALEGRRAAPGWFRELLPFVPVATLTAIVVPALARPAAGGDAAGVPARLAAGAAAAALAAVTRSVPLTLAGGFLVLWLAS